MSANVARDLKPVDALEVQVLVDNVTDSLSTVPKDVTNEVGLLMRNGTLKMAAGEYRCCAHHGLSLIITARAGKEKRTLIFDAGPEAYTVTRNGGLLKVPFGEAGAVSCCRTAIGTTRAGSSRRCARWSLRTAAARSSATSTPACSCRAGHCATAARRCRRNRCRACAS